MERGTVTDITVMLPLIERVAKDVHFMYGMDEEDAFGFLALEVVERARDYGILWAEGQTGLIEMRLKNIAGTHTRAERVKRSSETKQYFYDVEYVRLFLPFFFSHEDWDNGPAPEDASTRWRTGEARDTAMDISDAWGKLRGWQLSVIIERHLGRPNEDGGINWERIATAIGRKNANSAMDAYAKATRILAEEMNKVRAVRTSSHEGPGAREAISNAKANAIIANASS